MAKKVNLTAHIEQSPIGKNDYVTVDTIIDWCKENNQVAWLKDTAAKTYMVGDKPRRITFLQLRKEFYLQFFPSRVPTPREKKPTMYDKIAAL